MTCRLLSIAASMIGLLLTGCMHVPLSTIVRLWSFDVATADPGLIRVAVRIPEFLNPRAGGVKLTVTVTLPPPDGEVKKIFTMEEAKEPDEIARLARYARPGYRLAAFRLTAPDTENVRQLQARARSATQRTGTRTRGGIGVSAEACRTAPLKEGALLSSTYLLVDPREGYLIVLDDIDLRREIGETALRDNLPPCADYRP